MSIDQTVVIQKHGNILQNFSRFWTISIINRQYIYKYNQKKMFFNIVVKFAFPVLTKFTYRRIECPIIYTFLEK